MQSRNSPYLSFHHICFVPISVILSSSYSQATSFIHAKRLGEGLLRMWKAGLSKGSSVDVSTMEGPADNKTGVDMLLIFKNSTHNSGEHRATESKKWMRASRFKKKLPFLQGLRQQNKNKRQGCKFGPHKVDVCGGSQCGDCEESEVIKHTHTCTHIHTHTHSRTHTSWRSPVTCSA